VKFEPRLPRNDVNVSRTHPLREAANLVAGVALITLALVLAAFVAVEVAVRFMPAAWEQKAFSAWSDAMAGQDPRTPATQTLVDRLSARWPENPYTLRVKVMTEATPNAFAAPGGVILVTSGLLDTIGSENELAFVLGHEVGHFRGRDHLRALGRAVVVQIALQGVLGSSASGVPSLVSDLAERSFSRDQEHAADHFGLELVAAEYGHVAGATQFFTRLPDGYADLGDAVGAWFATHPVTEGRIEALEELASERGWRTDAPLTPLLEN
jgi:Zn-dependent protease with chaperone function